MRAAEDEMNSSIGFSVPTARSLVRVRTSVGKRITLSRPALRGTAMALYFCAMYLLGAAQGPWATGLTSDYFAQRAAAANENAVPAVVALLGGPLAADSSAEFPWAAIAVNYQYKQQAIATGLHQAMYLTVALSGMLVLVLLAAAWTVRSDYEKLQKWMKASASGPDAARRLLPSAPRRPQHRGDAIEREALDQVEQHVLGHVHFERPVPVR